MKKFYLIVLAVLAFTFSFAAPVIKSIKDGYWNQASSWNLNRLPKPGDTIVLAAGYTITINNDINLDKASFVAVYGRLTFQNNNSTLSLANGSFIWVYSGALIMGSGTPSQKIRISNDIIFDGNDDPIYGPMMASSSTNGFTAMSGFPSIALPVQFISFSATAQNSSTLLQWSTAQEVNVNMYEVQRSTDGTNWTTIAYVSPYTNNAASTNNYSFTDKNAGSKNTYYRIAEVDFGGKEMYSAIRSVKEQSMTAASVVIASTQNKVLLQFAQEIKGNVLVRFVSLNGQILDQQTISNPVGQVAVNSKFTGNYIISVSNGQDINTSKQVIL